MVMRQQTTIGRKVTHSESTAGSQMRRATADQAVRRSRRRARRQAPRVVPRVGSAIPTDPSSAAPPRHAGGAARRRVARAVRVHTTRAQWNASRITVIHAMTRPTPGPGRCTGAVCRDHTASSPVALASPEPASATQANAHRRVSSASIENPTRRPAPASRTPATAARCRHRWHRVFPNSTSTPARRRCAAARRTPATRTPGSQPPRRAGPGRFRARHGVRPPRSRRGTRRIASRPVGGITRRTRRFRRLPRVARRPACPGRSGRGRCPAAWASPARVRRWVRRRRRRSGGAARRR